MKAIVTGASGFIGGHLVRELTRQDYDVTCLVRPTSRLDHLRSLPLTFVEGDLREKSSLIPVVKGMDYVFHLAGVIQALESRAYFDANVQGTRHLIDACLEAAPGLKRFVYISSIGAMGPSPKGQALSEADTPHPISDYGRSKREAEKYVLSVGERLPVSILRPPNVLGPGQREIEEAVKLLRWKMVPVIGNGAPQTSLIDVDDLVAAILLVAENPRSEGELYFVTDNKTYAWRDITAAIVEEFGQGRFFIRIPFALQIAAAWISERVARMTGRPPRFTREIVRASKDHYWIYDGSKIERELGFRPEKSMRDGVRRAVAHMLQTASVHHRKGIS